MLTALPRLAALRAPALTRAARDLPPLVLAVRLSPHSAPDAGGTLLGRTVAVTATVHPVWEALLLAAGAVRERAGLRLRAPLSATPAEPVLAALAAPHPGTWLAAPGVTVSGTLGAPTVAALEAAGVRLGVARPRRLAGMPVRLRRSGAWLHLGLPDHLVVDGHRVGLGASGRLLLTPRRAQELVAAARRAGLVVLDADHGGRLADLEWLLERSCVVDPMPGAPGWASLRTGSLVAAPAGGAVPAAEAVALAGRIRGDVVTAVHPEVAQVAAVAAAEATGRPGLRPWQDAFVSAYQASGPGLVNALPPGAGKTVCAAAAMAERAAAAPAYRAVVLAPAGVRAQWARELARFFPDARVEVVEGAAGVPRLLRAWEEEIAPVVALLTPELLVRSEAALAALAPTDLVVDEATFLARDGSERVEACWRLRARSGAALPLTGTPQGRGADDEAALVAFARGRRDLFAAPPDGREHPPVPGPRWGPLLFTGPAQGLAEIPPAPPVPVPLAPGSAELAVEAAARARVGALLERAAGAGARRGAPQLRTELEAWRLGLSCPAALLSSRYALAGAARAAGAGDGPGVKLGWTVARAAELAAAGEQLLVFADFAAALAVLATALAQAGVPAATLASAVTPRRRQQAVAEFTAGTLPVLLVAATGQLGLNLQSAAHVVHLDVPTSAATLTQRGARAARLGSPHARVEVAVPVLAGCADAALLGQLRPGAPVADLWSVARQLVG